MNAPETGIGPYRTDALPFENSYASLPPVFYTRLPPTPVPGPYLVGASAAAAELIHLDPAEFGRTSFLEAFAGNCPLPGSIPLSAVYSGHQFGVWAGQLGDGRAILLGDVDQRRCRAAWNCSSKAPAARPTRAWATAARCCARRSANSCARKPWHALGIPTTRALCVIGSDMPRAARDARNRRRRHAHGAELRALRLTSNISTTTRG